MNKQQILEKVTDILFDIFDDDDLHITSETTAKDIDGWDSLAHISILAAICDTFHISFSIDDVHNMKNVGDMVDVIDRLL